MKHLNLLRTTDSFIVRKSKSEEQINEIREIFDLNIDSTQYSDIAIYCGGSLGRGDFGKNSDLDLFILSNKKSKDIKRIERLKLLSSVIRINKKLGFNEFSNDGQYLHVYSFPDMLDALGSPVDDIHNLFTARMLLLLESKPIFNNENYSNQFENAINHYYRDSKNRKSFRPLFLINDILRYWRTLCLNYELIRNDINRPWRKKNINLKFSRMLTIFGTILPLISKPASTKECVINLIKLTPLERLAIGIDYMKLKDIQSGFVEFISIYENFLKLKENMGSKSSPDDTSFDRETKKMENSFSWFLYKCLTHENINKEYIKYLIL